MCFDKSLPSYNFRLIDDFSLTLATEQDFDTNFDNFESNYTYRVDCINKFIICNGSYFSNNPARKPKL